MLQAGSRIAFATNADCCSGPKEIDAIKAALVKAKRVADVMTLYRLVDLKFNPTPGNELHFEEYGPPYAASCTSKDGTTIFQIVYRKNFVDAFRFRGRRLEKTGAYFDPKEQLVHWYEDLIKHD